MGEDKSNYDIAADLGFPPIKAYQDEVAARGYVTNQEYRAGLRAEGVRIPSRHQVLMTTKPTGAERKEEVRKFHEAVARVTAKFEGTLAEAKANAPTSREKQITRDQARGAYESRTFLEATLRMKGIEPAAEISGMKAQYEEWKWLSQGADPGPGPSEPESPVTNKWAHNRRVSAEEATA
jgi:hypothetical protein